MSKQPLNSAAKQEAQREFLPKRIRDWPTRTKTVAGALISSLGVLIYTALADPPQPVLSITPLGSNQFNIVITNAVATNYTLFWTPALENPLYPWQVLGVGETGQTNFIVNGGEWPLGFLRVMVGDDFDGDLIPEWMDAQSFNPNVGALRVTIDTPINGTVFN